LSGSKISTRDEADDEDRLHGDDEPVRNDRAAREHDDEGQEVERERKHPQQRHRRDIVEMCAVTATSRPDGTAASATQDAALRQVGGASAASVAAAVAA